MSRECDKTKRQANITSKASTSSLTPALFRLCLMDSRDVWRIVVHIDSRWIWNWTIIGKYQSHISIIIWRDVWSICLWIINTIFAKEYGLGYAFGILFCVPYTCEIYFYTHVKYLSEDWHFAIWHLLSKINMYCKFKEWADLLYISQHDSTCVISPHV